jgi:hypothetical protein
MHVSTSPETLIPTLLRHRRQVADRVPARASVGSTRMTPIGAVARGLAAGALGTMAMDVLWFSRYRRGGGDSGFAAWELSAGLSGWEHAPAPALVGKRLVEGLFARTIPASRAALVSNVTHWTYGMLGGAQYGMIAGSLRRPRVRYGVPFGSSVWATGYAVLPAAHLYKPIWQYDADALAKDLSAHLVYGLGTAAAFRLMSGSRSDATKVAVHSS